MFAIGNLRRIVHSSALALFVGDSQLQTSRKPQFVCFPAAQLDLQLDSCKLKPSVNCQEEKNSSSSFQFTDATLGLQL